MTEAPDIAKPGARTPGFAPAAAGTASSDQTLVLNRCTPKTLRSTPVISPRVA